MRYIDKIAAQFSQLDLAEAEELDQRLQEYIDSLKSSGQRRTTEAGTPEKVTYEQGGGTYQKKWVKCGKPNCKCARGERHGPYLYRAKYQGGKTKWEYVGKA